MFLSPAATYHTDCAKLGKDVSKFPDHWRCAACTLDPTSLYPRKCIGCDKPALTSDTQPDESSPLFSCKRCKSVIHWGCTEEALMPFLLTYWECQYCLKCALSFSDNPLSLNLLFPLSSSCCRWRWPVETILTFRKTTGNLGPVQSVEIAYPVEAAEQVLEATPSDGNLSGALEVVVEVPSEDSPVPETSSSQLKLKLKPLAPSPSPSPKIVVVPPKKTVKAKPKKKKAKVESESESDFFQTPPESESDGSDFEEAMRAKGKAKGKGPEITARLTRGKRTVQTKKVVSSSSSSSESGEEDGDDYDQDQNGNDLEPAPTKAPKLVHLTKPLRAFTGDEYLVKFKEVSHSNNAWVPEWWLHRVATLKLKNFLAKQGIFFFFFLLLLLSFP